MANVSFHLDSLATPINWVLTLGLVGYAFWHTFHVPLPKPKNSKIKVDSREDWDCPLPIWRPSIEYARIVYMLFLGGMSYLFCIVLFSAIF